MDLQKNSQEQGFDATKNNESQVISSNANSGNETSKTTIDTTIETEENVLNEQSNTSNKPFTTKQEIIDKIKTLASSETVPSREEIDSLKSTFYRIHLAEREAEQKAYLEAGGDPLDYKVTPSEDEMIFKAELSLIKEKRAKLLQEQEKERQENLKQKLTIIESIKAIATSPDEANKSYTHFKELQAKWKEINNVPADKVNELWRTYQLYTEQFYDLLKLNHEAREYDFKKNLELKSKLCEAAEKLAEEKDVVSAFHQLQELHQQYREIGPVSKENREQIWTRFKNASTVINKRHQQHFEELRSKEEENLVKKTNLCEKVEAINAKKIQSISEWEKTTEEVTNIQKEWKTIGFTPQKMNVKIFERFREACNTFFQSKTTFFKELKASFAENIEKKKALIEKAKNLADSTEWKSTSDKLITLQKEWKKVGFVPQKVSDKLWEEFVQYCNKFFDARKAANGDSHSEEHKNLEHKENILKELKGFIATKAEDASEKIHQLIKEYNQIGHVPYKEKDRLYTQFKEVTDQLKKELNISINRKRLDDFKNNLKNVASNGENALYNERNKLFRAYERIKQELQTYENNLGFLSAASKKGNSLINNFTQKTEKLKEEMQLLKEKIKEIDRQQKEESNNE
ncbi:MAG: DUF349 domain-containing protein [Prevotella sp.]